MSISDFKISTKLITAFVLTALFGAVLTGLAVWRMQQLSQADTQLYEHKLLGLSYIKEANVERLKAVVAIRDAVLASDSKDRDGAMARFNDGRSKAREFIEKAARLPMTPESQQALADLQNALNKDQQGLDVLMPQIMHSEFTPTSEVLLHLRKTVAPHSIQFGVALNKLSQLKEVEAEKVAQANQTLYAHSRDITLVTLVLGLVVSLVLGVSISRHVTTPLGRAVQSAQRMSQGDMSERIQVKGSDELAQLLQSLESMRGHLHHLVERVRQGAQAVSTASAEIAQGNQDLSNRTESQASVLQATASGMDSLSCTVQQNAEHALEANQLAHSASAIAVQGGQVVSEVVHTMQDINQSSQKIADIISVIDGIAFQTNILALNAAVEAARAGEQGRGFAVVASEVRALASRSAQAAKEIKVLINDSVERVTKGSALADRAGHTMEEIVTSIQRVTAIMGDISAASSGQSQGVGQMGAAVAQIDHTTQQNAALVEEMAAATASLRTQSQDLVEAVSVFKLDHTGNTPLLT